MTAEEIPAADTDRDRRAFRILFVCTANICRSPMAEHLLRGSLAALLDTGGAFRFEVSSAGIRGWDGEPMDPAAAAELRRLGGDPSRFTQWHRVSIDQGLCPHSGSSPSNAEL